MIDINKYEAEIKINKLEVELVNFIDQNGYREFSETELDYINDLYCDIEELKAYVNLH